MTESLTINIKPTQDPHSLMFFTDLQLYPGGVMHFKTERDVLCSDLARALFNIEDVQELSFSENFALITKTKNAAWDFLKPDIMLVIHEFAKEPIFKYQVSGLITDDELVTKAKEIIEKSIKPVVVADGGTIEVFGRKENTIHIRLDQACANCPSAGGELKDRIERLLKFRIPSIEGVSLI